ncbi:MAG: hypothetical protein V9E88_08200 [Ferruginibacter sp.]
MKFRKDILNNYLPRFFNKVKAEQQPAKVISMGNRPSVFRYAAAAVVTGILGLTLFNAIFKPAQGKYFWY